MYQRIEAKGQNLIIYKTNHLYPNLFPEYTRALNKLGLTMTAISDFSDPKGKVGKALMIGGDDRLNNHDLSQFPTLGFVLTASVGFNHIDLDECSRRGILVSHCPDYATIAVAEHTLGLMLAVSKRIVEADRSMREGEWGHLEFRGTELYGKKLGIIGFGRIGRRVAAISEPLGMDITTVDIDATYEERERLLRESDIISLHVPLDSSTKHMIGRRQIEMMKNGVIIINTARGPVLDQESLIQGLVDGRVGGAGLDVYEKEPLEPVNVLRKLKNVVLTPHAAAVTHEARARVARECFEILFGYFTGAQINYVNA